MSSHTASTADAVLPPQPTSTPDDCVGSAFINCTKVLQHLQSTPSSMQVDAISCIEYLRHAAHWLDYLVTLQAAISARQEQQQQAAQQQPQQPLRRAN